MGISGGKQAGREPEIPAERQKIPPHDLTRGGIDVEVILFAAYRKILQTLGGSILKYKRQNNQSM